jgi:hypothetical protein
MICDYYNKCCQKMIPETFRAEAVQAYATEIYHICINRRRKSEINNDTSNHIIEYILETKKFKATHMHIYTHF